MTYEIQLWNGINAPGRELGRVFIDTLPSTGDVVTMPHVQNESEPQEFMIMNIWRCGAKIESPERYTATVKIV